MTVSERRGQAEDPNYIDLTVLSGDGFEEIFAQLSRTLQCSRTSTTADRNTLSVRSGAGPSNFKVTSTGPGDFQNSTSPQQWTDHSSNFSVSTSAPRKKTTGNGPNPRTPASLQEYCQTLYFSPPTVQSSSSDDSSDSSPTDFSGPRVFVSTTSEDFAEGRYLMKARKEHNAARRAAYQSLSQQEKKEYLAHRKEVSKKRKERREAQKRAQENAQRKAQKRRQKELARREAQERPHRKAQEQERHQKELARLQEQHQKELERLQQSLFASFKDFGAKVIKPSEDTAKS